MSTEWTIRCVDCDEKGGATAVNRSGLQDLRDLIEIASPLAELGRAAATAKTGIYVHCGYGDPQDGVDLQFFLKHQGHRLVAHDEYGCDDGQCMSKVECVCGERLRCGLNAGHQGPCQGTDRGKRRP